MSRKQNKNNKLSVDKYIDCSRLLKKPYQNSSYNIFNYYYRLLDIIISIEETIPEFRICYSVNRKCEQATISGQNYIVYDRYLGETLSFLTFLFFNRTTDETDVFRYLNKCEAEMYLCSGQFSMAAIHGRLYEELARKGDANDNYHSIRHWPKTSNSLFEELFVVFHEIYHWKLRSNEDREIIINNRRKHILNTDPRKTRNKLIIIDDNVSAEKQREDERRWLSSDDNIEEILCDEYAFTRLLKISNKLLPKELQNSFSITIAESCILCLDNLTFLSIAQWDADYLTEEAFERAIETGQIIPKEREALLDDSLYRMEYFVYDTALRNLKHERNTIRFLRRMLQMHFEYHSIILRPVLNKKMLDSDLSALEKIESNNDFKGVLTRIPKWE